jgi:hypothetical protein
VTGDPGAMRLGRLGEGVGGGDDRAGAGAGRQVGAGGSADGCATNRGHLYTAYATDDVKLMNVAAQERRQEPSILKMLFGTDWPR